MRPVSIGGRLIGPGQPTFFVAEIGINHNGDLETAKRLIEVARRTKCDAVKFQKRTVEVVYTPEELAPPRESPFGSTNGDLKHCLELDEEAYAQIDEFCLELGILWFASCWDEGSVDFIERFNPPCHKIASACLTDDRLLRHVRATRRPVILSTGMSTLEQIDHAIEVLGKENLILLHCTSTYPSSPEELNFRMIPRLMERYDVPVGYSGHEVMLFTSLVAVALGACVIERHITLSRAMCGTDQAASVEPQGIAKLVHYIRTTEAALGDGEKQVYASEVPVMRKLRRVGL
jgi:N-acetylneuraminate synthase